MSDTPIRRYFMLILTFLLSFVGTVGLMGLGALAVAYALQTSALHGLAASLINSVGSAVTFIIVGTLLYIVLFVWISTRLVFKRKPDLPVSSSAGWALSLRWKLLVHIALSCAAVAAFLFVGYLLSTALLTIRPLSYPLEWLINWIGSVPLMIVTGIAVFLVSFVILTNELMDHLEKLGRGLQEISAGHLDHRVDIGTRDEAGWLAEQMNGMSEQLSKQIHEITQGLKQMEQGQFDALIPEGAGDFGLIAASINRMARKLDQLIRDERLAEQTKHDLITGVSHDLRTPLTSILGFLELIEKDRYQDEVELRYYINIAYEKALTLQQLIDDLFEYTRVNNGLPLHKSRIDMVGFIQQLADEFVPTLEKHKAELRIEASEPVLELEADGSLLVRSYENLISNAIRYGGEDKYVDLKLFTAEGHLVIQVINYGPPIPERDIPHLFDRFYRVERSRSKQTGGTGLGLAIAKSIVEAHGGRIEVQSNQERTLFQTSYPL